MSVASCRIIFLLSDVVFNRVFAWSRFGFRFVIGFRLVVVRVVGFCPVVRPNPVHPSPARPGPGPRAPGARARRPAPPHAPPLPSLPFPSFNFSRAATSSPPPLTLPRCALGFGDGDRRIWTPR
jgi:hypothetical protein